MEIALLGTGLMGAAIAGRLAGHGFDVTVYNRTTSRARALVNAGCRLAATSQEAIADARFVILTLADADAITTVLADPQVAGGLAGRTVIQMGTVAAAESRDLERRMNAAGADYLEAPVLGSIPEARTGTLLVMAAGPQRVFDHCLPLLEVLGETPLRVGDTGQAATLKLALNQLIASLTTAFSLSLALVRSEGGEVETFMGLLRQSALYAPTFDKKLKRMLEHDYGNPNFPTRHLVKDIRLFNEQARGHGIDTGMLEAIEGTVARAIAAGFGDADYSALYEGVKVESGSD